MFNLRYLLVRQDWEEHTVPIERDDLTFAYMTAIRILKYAANISALDFIPLGSGQYLIWGQGKCQGYMAIKEVGQKTSVQDLGGGQ